MTGSDRNPRDEHVPFSRFDDSRLINGDNHWTRTIYPYCLPDGTVLYEQCRYDPIGMPVGTKKKFWPRMPKPSDPASGEYVFGVPPRHHLQLAEHYKGTARRSGVCLRGRKERGGINPPWLLRHYRYQP
jgi:hypothetical protein